MRFPGCNGPMNAVDRRARQSSAERLVARAAGGLGLLAYGLGPALAQPDIKRVPAPARAFIDKNCISCHQSAGAPAGLDLTALAFDLDDAQSFGRWVRIHDVVRDGVMP